MTAEIAIFLAAGFLGGSVNAAAGGAKLFVFPLLLASGMPPVAANVTQGIALWPAQLPAAWVYRRELAQDLRGLVRLMLPALAGSLAGAAVMVNASDEAFVAVVPLLLAIAVAAIVLGPRTTALMRWAFPGERRMGIATGVLLGAIGFYGGFFGAGMGFMLLAVLAAAAGTGIAQVNGAKTLTAFAIQSVAVVPWILSGLADWVAVGFVLVGGMAGGWVGATLVRRLPGEVVRYGTAALGVVLTLSFFLS
jgi:uncharacterized membrane protein YfcA